MRHVPAAEGGRVRDGAGAGASCVGLVLTLSAAAPPAPAHEDGYRGWIERRAPVYSESREVREGPRAGQNPGFSRWKEDGSLSGLGHLAFSR